MRRFAVALLIAATVLLGQPAGEYRFVQLGVGEKPRNVAGTITFDGNGGYQVRGRLASGAAAASPWSFKGTAVHDAESAAVTLTNPAGSGAPLRLRASASGGVLVASSAKDAELFIAVKPGEAAPRGKYAGAYFALNGAKPEGAVTAFFDFAAEEAGRVGKARVNGHAAAVDDTNRAEETAVSAAFGSGGASVTFGESESLSGAREVFVSADGSVLIGYTPGHERRDLLVAVRSAPAEPLPPAGLYGVEGLNGESERVFRPEKTRLWAASGVARIDGDGRVLLSELAGGAGHRLLTTVNYLRISEDGSAGMAASVRPGLRNVAVSEDAGLLISSQVGMPSELTLGHGLLIGLRMAAPALSAGNAASPDAPVAAVSPGLLIVLRHPGLTARTAVRVNGAPARIVQSGPGEAVVHLPEDLKGESVRIEAESLAALRLPLERSSPGVFPVCLHPDRQPVESARPARPGQELILRVTGLDKAMPKVFAAGKPAEVLARAPDSPGVEALRVRLPGGLRPLVPAPIAVDTGSAFSDLTEIPIGAP